LRRCVAVAWWWSRRRRVGLGMTATDDDDETAGGVARRRTVSTALRRHDGAASYTEVRRLATLANAPYAQSRARGNILLGSCAPDIKDIKAFCAIGIMSCYPLVEGIDG